jgi:hypothetical protein
VSSSDRHPERGAGGPVTGFRCRGCGQWHEDVPLAFHAPAPAVWAAEMAGQPGCELGSDQCVISDEHFFLRGLVRIPVVDREQHFEWGVWVSLSRESFRRTSELWETEGREHVEPMFGWLCTELPTYERTTLDLRTRVHTQPVGSRPLVEIEESEHPVSVEQRHGITWETLTSRVAQLLHPA